MSISPSQYLAQVWFISGALKINTENQELKKIYQKPVWFNQQTYKAKGLDL
jgi:hypothetical protein